MLQLFDFWRDNHGYILALFGVISGTLAFILKSHQNSVKLDENIVALEREKQDRRKDHIELEKVKSELDRLHAIVLVMGRFHFLVSDPGPERYPLCPKCGIRDGVAFRMIPNLSPDGSQHLACPACRFCDAFPFDSAEAMFAAAESAIAERRS